MDIQVFFLLEHTPILIRNVAPMGLCCLIGLVSYQNIAPMGLKRIRAFTSFMDDDMSFLEQNSPKVLFFEMPVILYVNFWRVKIHF
jgi:hypothetical protein